MRGAPGPVPSTKHTVGMMAHACRACDPSTQEEETGGSEAQDHPWKFEASLGFMRPYL